MLQMKLGSPWESACRESFNGKMRVRCLTVRFSTTSAGSVILGVLRKEYYMIRPHGSLEQCPPPTPARIFPSGQNAPLGKCSLYTGLSVAPHN
ncbi:MAG: transposase [Desulfovibrio sp.]|nr:transposase [Desulfovibrio sp.]MBI4960277.1 transposase [Desulfovibrio sp.]